MNITSLPSTLYNISHLTNATTYRISHCPSKLSTTYLTESDIDFELQLVETLLKKRHSHPMIHKGLKEVRSELEKQVAHLYSLLSLNSQTLWIWRRFWYDDKLTRQLKVVQTLHKVMKRRLELYNSLHI
jgi:hypothetical protein